jgi:NAD(P)-dependent dehydrogenase (short-subunit alcohol dehydrogenase family)
VRRVKLAYDRQNQNSLLAGQTALVTGASSGVGRAIALALARQGANLCVVGRKPEALAETAAAAKQFSSVVSFELDLTDESSIRSLSHYFDRAGRLDILVHCAGIFHQNLMAQACVADFDRQYAINVRVPYMLSQRLLPLLTTSRGQIVFINSSVGHSVKRPEVGQYAATKHALKAVADSLREEVNQKGVRVLSVYLGRTATPMQRAICQREGREYRPETLLQPIDIASVVINALGLPPTAEVTDVFIRPMVNFSNAPAT